MPRGLGLNMKHTYQILDMSCGGCKASVEKALLALSDIHKVEVDLATHCSHFRYLFVVLDAQTHICVLA
jgi:copper chaperone CopZ